MSCSQKDNEPAFNLPYILSIVTASLLSGVKANGGGFTSDFVIAASTFGLFFICLWALGHQAGVLLLSSGIAVLAIFGLGLLGMWTEAAVLFDIWGFITRMSGFTLFLVLASAALLIAVGRGLMLSDSQIDRSLDASAQKSEDLRQRVHDSKGLTCRRCNWKGTRGQWNAHGVCPTCGNGQYSEDFW